MKPLIRLEHITKTFGRITALEDICLELHPNEVVGLIGDNGAGKSTLVSIIAGVLRADSGRLAIKEHEMDLRRYSVSRARSFGIETVHQRRALGDQQPIWRNLFMGRHRTNRLGMIKHREEKQSAMAVLKDFMGLTGVGIHPDSPVSKLSGGERQGLAIGRAVYFDSDIVILDEPFNALAINEVQKVLKFIRRLKQAKKAVIIISHNLQQIYDVSDRFVLMDRGRIINHIMKSDTSLDALTRILMKIAGTTP
ncbi:MAG: ATP-binding cassette domain-containing protein [Desulfobacterales bacterium]|nr:ATP-binding cassette domain-containing protein [Desulfobacterales bacterium]